MRLRALFLLVVLGGMFVIATVAHARDVVATNFNAPSVDLTGVIEYLNTPDKEIVVPVPAGDGGRETAMTVTAKGPGESHHFAALTLYNEEPLPRDFVLVARWPGYVGSGILWPHFGATQVLNMQAAPGLQPQKVSQPHADAYALRLGPGETVTYVAELTGSHVPNLTLWQRAAYDKQQQQLSFFRGVVLGIAALTAVFMLCLFIVRMQWAFPAAALFAFSSVAFIALEFGYLPTLAPALPQVAGLEVRIRGVVEALMAAGALACLLTFLDLTRRAPVLGYGILGTFVGGLVLAAAAWFAPAVGTGLARILLLATAVGGLAIIIAFWRRGMIRAQASLVSWCFLLLWTICSFAAALGWIDIEMVGPILAWGLVLVLLTMAFTMTQFAFNQGVINSRFFEDSGRRGLALAGAEQIVWDWNEEAGTLFVGPELERVLGHAKGRIDRGGLKGWLELIHPSDRSAYVGAIESAVQRGRGTFSQEFRLRRGDGTYRWFQLRARSLPGDFGRAVRCIGTLSDVTGMKRSEEQLLSDAVRDRITSLPNQALFMDRLERAMRRAEMTGNGELYLMLVDLDRFRTVNDSLGFAVGDSLLLTIARRLTSLVGSTDTLARLHGDRFGIILDTAQSGMALDTYLENLRKLVARPVPLRPQEVFLTASIGVARYALDKMRPEQLLKDAEIALYEAKRQGKDSLVTFAPEMRNSQPVLLDLEEGLRQALERNQIEVAYQPVMRLHDRALAGFEALVRWRHEKYGLLEPDAFMKLAEDLGLMNELGCHVLSQAARQLGIWQRAYRSEEPLFVTVNVSSRELINRDLIDEVKTVLSREDLVPGTLKLELTETVLMENPELSVKILERLQQIGVGIACDDFGTGYSALAHLKRLPFDTIKIDRCFLEGEADDEGAQIILESIVLLAHDLGMDTVVEGIEAIDQADRLREIGCDFGQGYLFGEPMSARQVMEMFGGSRSIAGKGARGASLWQRLMKRADNAEDRSETRREAPRPVETRATDELPPAKTAPPRQGEMANALPEEALLAAEPTRAQVQREVDRQPEAPAPAAPTQPAAGNGPMPIRPSLRPEASPNRPLSTGMPPGPGMQAARPSPAPPAGATSGPMPVRQAAGPPAAAPVIRPAMPPAAASGVPSSTAPAKSTPAAAVPASASAPSAPAPVPAPVPAPAASARSASTGSPPRGPDETLPPPAYQPPAVAGLSRFEPNRERTLAAINLSEPRGGQAHLASDQAGSRDQKRAGFAIGLSERPFGAPSRLGDGRPLDGRLQGTGPTSPSGFSARPTSPAPSKPGAEGETPQAPETSTAPIAQKPAGSPASRPAAGVPLVRSAAESGGSSWAKAVDLPQHGKPALQPPAESKAQAPAAAVASRGLAGIQSGVDERKAGRDAQAASSKPGESVPVTEPAAEAEAVPGRAASVGKAVAGKSAKDRTEAAPAKTAQPAADGALPAESGQPADAVSEGPAKKRSKSRASAAQPAGDSVGAELSSDAPPGDPSLRETSAPVTPSPGQRSAMMAKVVGELRAIGEQSVQQAADTHTDTKEPAPTAVAGPYAEPPAAETRETEPREAGTAQASDGSVSEPAAAGEISGAATPVGSADDAPSNEAGSTEVSQGEAAEKTSTAAAANPVEASGPSAAPPAEDVMPHDTADSADDAGASSAGKTTAAAVAIVAETVGGGAKASQSSAAPETVAGPSIGRSEATAEQSAAGLANFPTPKGNMPAKSAEAADDGSAQPQTVKEKSGQTGGRDSKPAGLRANPPPPPPVRRFAAAEGAVERLVADPEDDGISEANGTAANAAPHDRPPPPLKRLLRRKPPAKPQS